MTLGIEVQVPWCDLAIAFRCRDRRVKGAVTVDRGEVTSAIRQLTPAEVRVQPRVD